MTWQSKLIRWYRTHKRDLPWRRNPSPYRVLVSEFMLQQTTVKTVIPYYHRFLKRFPSLKALASARETEVLTAWSGLGYYARARNLHRTAQICRRELGGRIPSDIDTLQGLPGIGAYTAGAIASIAYEQKAAIVDGNVARVLSRLCRIEADPKSPRGLKSFWEQAHTLLPRRHFGDFNQGLMELGATVCTPTRPNCHLCPLRTDCLAYAHDQVTAFPKLKTQIIYRTVRLSASLIARGHRFLMIQRPEHGVLRDMWEFPMVEGDVDELMAAYALNLGRGQELPPIRHSIMNQRITVTPWLFRTNEAFGKKPPRSRWVRKAELRCLPTSGIVHKLLNVL
jgi:A/G-specific adenine glycosylase